MANQATETNLFPLGAETADGDADGDVLRGWGRSRQLI